MSKKRVFTAVAAILFILGIACIVAAAVIGTREKTAPCVQYGDVTTEEYTEPELDPGLEFLTEHEWIREVNCEEHISFGRDGYFSYWCSCGSPVDNYDLYDSYTYRNDRITVTGEDGNVGMDVIYHDENYLCLYLEEEKECRVFIDEGFANDPYVEHQNENYAAKGWLGIDILSYDDETLTAAPYNYDRDAHGMFREYIRDIPAAEEIEFYSVTTVDDNGEVTTEHFKLGEEDIEHIGEYYTSGYAQLDKEGRIKYMVFYGKTTITG